MAKKKAPAKKGRPPKKATRVKRTYTRKPKNDWQPLSASAHSVEWFTEYYRSH
jgi:hypothetical protein